MKTYALARLAAVVSLGAPTTSCRWSAELAQEAGATEEEIVGVLWAVGPIVGLARVVAAAPALALAIGYDVEAAFEKPSE
jgi:4-carboxymuconolactone decarboxylase